MPCRRRFVVTAILSMTCTLAQSATAQTQPQLAKGVRVRVVFPAADGRSERHVNGRLVRLGGDTVVVVAGGGLALPDTVVFALGDGRRLEALVASRGHGKTGAVVGTVFGALAGGVIGAATWRPCTQEGLFACIMYPSSEEQAAGGAVLGAAAGAVLGLVVGSAIRTETWEPLHTAGVRLAVAPGAVGISLAF